MSTYPEHVILNQPPTHGRRVSISTDPSFDNISQPRSRKTSAHAYDNPGFDSPRSRKVSATSDHAEIGPVRKKSILHNSQHPVVADIQGDKTEESGKHANGDARIKKHSVTDSVHSKTRFSDIDEDDGRSWWYTFCIKCRQKETLPSWQPQFWHKVCPYPFCLTYRQFSRIVALSLIGVLSWGIVYAIVGETAAPGGQLFQLILLALCAHFGGWLVTLTTLPALIGMLFTGLIFQNVGIVDMDESFSEVRKELRKIALVIILTRAGLDLDPQALKRLKFTTLKLGVIPWTVEAGIMAILSHFLLDLPWSWGLLLGAIIAAISPAVVVPCLFRLRSKGYGVAKGIPTLIIAVAGIDDALSVAIFGIIQSIMFSDDSLTLQILQGPICIVGGIGFGVLWGIISNFAPERHDPFMVPLRILMLLVGGLIAVFGSELIGYEGAGPLGVVAAAFVSLVCWSRSGWDIEDNPASTAFEIFWMIFEPVLFSITGAQIKLKELDPHVVSLGIACLIVGVVIRVLVTVVVGIGCKLNLKEKICIGLSWMAKATVQAALGPVALGVVGDNPLEQYYAKVVLMVCVMSIILTAPTGAILITITGPRLLTKTRFPQVPEGWRRSHRPSIRDISIIDEEEERDQSLENGSEDLSVQKDKPDV